MCTSLNKSILFLSLLFLPLSLCFAESDQESPVPVNTVPAKAESSSKEDSAKTEESDRGVDPRQKDSSTENEEGEKSALTKKHISQTEKDDIPFKSNRELNKNGVGKIYMALLVLIIVLIAVLVILRKKIGLNLYHGVSGDRINIIERKKIGPQTYVSLISVDGKLISVVENATAVSLLPMGTNTASAEQESAKNIHV